MPAATSLTFDILARDRASKTFDKIGDKASGTGRAVGKLAAGFAAIGVGGLLKSAVGEASDLGESVNAVNVSFGKASKGVLALGKNSARSMGLSNKEFNGLAVRFSSFATTIAGKGGDVTKTLETLTGRAADFASVMNIDVADAAALFQSGLAGESEPLRKYGIDISAAAVETFAYANGIAKAGEELTEQQKVQARYGAIMEQTKKTAGDFANTSDSLANAQRILSATFDDTKAKVGAVLLPAMAAAVSFVGTDVLPAFEKVGPKIVEGFTAFKESEAVTGLRRLASGIVTDIESSDAWNFGQKILNRIQLGFSTGDWGPLGRSIKDGLGRIDPFEVGRGLGDLLRSAVQNLGDLAAPITTFVGTQIDRVNWGDLAFRLGKQVPTLLLGLVTGILNFDLGSMLSFLKDKWFQVLMGVLTVAFAPARVIAGVAGVLRRIPLVGPLLAWGLTAFKTFSDKIVSGIGTMVSRFATGFLSNFPRVTSAFSRSFELLRIRLFVWGDDAVKWIRALPGRFQTAIGAGMEALGKFFGRVWSALWEGAKRTSGAAISTMAAVFLGLVSTLVEGAAQAFGWVPGIGPKLQTAAAEFRTFRDNANAALNGITRSVDIKVAIRTEGLRDAAMAARAGSGPNARGDGPGRGGRTLSRLQSLIAGSGAYVTSTYRSPAHNRRIGGSPTSYHMDRNNPAVDIAGPTRVLDRLHGQIRAAGPWRELLWQVPNHYDHIHVAHKGGKVSSSWPRMPGDAPDERTARLQVGEVVIPAGRGGGGTTVVNLTINAGTLVHERQVATMMNDILTRAKRSGVQLNFT